MAAIPPVVPKAGAPAPAAASGGQNQAVEALIQAIQALPARAEPRNPPAPAGGPDRPLLPGHILLCQFRNNP